MRFKFSQKRGVGWRRRSRRGALARRRAARSAAPPQSSARPRTPRAHSAPRRRAPAPSPPPPAYRESPCAGPRAALCRAQPRTPRAAACARPTPMGTMLRRAPERATRLAAAEKRSRNATHPPTPQTCHFIPFLYRTFLIACVSRPHRARRFCHKRPILTRLEVSLPPFRTRETRQSAQRRLLHKDRWV